MDTPSLKKFCSSKYHAVQKKFLDLFRSLTSAVQAFVTFWQAVFSQWLHGIVLLMKTSIKQSYRISLYLLFLGILLLLPGQNHYEQTVLSAQTTNLNRPPVILPSPAPYPVNITRSLPPILTANGIMVVDVASGVSLYEKNPDMSLAPASTTKILTALVALDHFQPNSIITVKEITSEGSTMGLVVGEQITLESLLYGVLVNSGNDAAIAIASAFPGGTPAFVEEMNKKAKILNLTSSHFTNPIGFDNPYHYMSARDLARLSLVAMKNPLIAKIASTRTISVSDVTYTRFHDLVNVNQLLGRIPGIAGLKTGYTEQAGESLVALMIKPQAKVVSVLLGSKERFSETEQILLWALANFNWTLPLTDSSTHL